MFEAKSRYGLDILNYTVTSNHVHLLVVDGDRDVIPKSLQLVAGKTAQESTKEKIERGHFGKPDTTQRPSRRVSIFSVAWSTST